MVYEPIDGASIQFVFNEYYRPRKGDSLYLGTDYYPLPGDGLWFDFSGLYDPPSGDAIAFGDVTGGGSQVVTVTYDLRATVSTKALTTAATRAAVSNLKSSAYDTRAAVYQIPIVSTTFDLRARVSNYKTIATDTRAALSIIAPEAKPDFAVVWGEKAAVDAGTGAGWKNRKQLTTSIGMGWVKRLLVENKVSSPWVKKNAEDSSRRMPFADCPEKIERTTDSPWKAKAISDHLRALPWDQSKGTDVDRHSNSISPPANDLFKGLAYDSKRIVDLGAFEMPWGNPPPKDLLHRTVWGKEYYQEICWRAYAPADGGQVDFNIHVPITQVDDGENIRFYFDKFSYDRRCSWREPSGWRDAYFYIKPDLTPAGPWASVYIMMNTAYLTRLPERTPIDITGMTIATDWDSLYWSINAGIGSDASLALLEPTEEGPVLVEASINGHLWQFQVDRWSTGKSFGSNSRSINGRSISAQLGAPTAEIRTYTEANERTAQQLMAYELEDTGWSVTFELDDWLIPAGIHCYQDQTPMQVIKAIADTCRAIVQTDMLAKTLTIKPRYKVAPWLLDSATADLVIPASMATRLDGEWDERPFFNSVFVSGEAGGISAKISREGSAGDLEAPMITSKLITATEVARSLGVAVLGGSGKWSKHSIELPVFTAPTVPGIIQPGSIIEYKLGATSWKGFVSSVSVSAPRTREGLKVRQTIDVERYHGN